eukprot:IDg13365t1
MPALRAFSGSSSSTPLRTLFLMPPSTPRITDTPRAPPQSPHTPSNAPRLHAPPLGPRSRHLADTYVPAMPHIPPSLHGTHGWWTLEQACMEHWRTMSSAAHVRAAVKGVLGFHSCDSHVTITESYENQVT